jgi:hypothetical protein
MRRWPAAAQGSKPAAGATSRPADFRKPAIRQVWTPTLPNIALQNVAGSSDGDLALRMRSVLRIAAVLLGARSVLLIFHLFTE